MVVGFSWRPVGESYDVFIGPHEHTRQGQVVQTSPHVTGGCRSKQSHIGRLISDLQLYVFIYFLSICIHTQVEVALHPALLLHGMDGNKLRPQIPARTPSGVPSLFVSKRFVAEVSKLIPVRPGASQLWWQDDGKRDSAERMKEAGNNQTDYE